MINWMIKRVGKLFGRLKYHWRGAYGLRNRINHHIYARLYEKNPFWCDTKSVAYQWHLRHARYHTPGPLIMTNRALIKHAIKKAVQRKNRATEITL